MVVLFVPVLLMALMIFLVLGISFLCIEIVIRMIGRGLASVAVEQAAITRPGNASVKRGKVERTTSGLRAVTAQF